MFIVESIKRYLAAHGACLDYVVQPYKWEEKKGTKPDKYLVIQPYAGGDADREFENIPIRLIFVGAVRSSKITLGKEVEAVKRIFLNNVSYEDVWFIDIIGNPVFYETADERPFFELNLIFRKVVYH